MAIKISETQLNLARKRYYGKFYFTNDLTFIKVLINKILISFLKFKISIVNLNRKIFSFFIKISNSSTMSSKKVNFNVNIDKSDLAKYSSDLEKKNFAFIENFLTKDCYQHILDNWPSINFFNHNQKIIKFYSIGFRNRDKKKLDYNNSIKNTYNFIESLEFEKFINELVYFEKAEYRISGIASTMVGNNSFLAPHVDGVQKIDRKTYNFIYFIDGDNSDPLLSGGTGIYSDNNFEKPIFLPTTLKNSVLVYNTTTDFYHGFNFTNLQNNVYRKTINFHFSPKHSETN